jgi:hypothetical protein
MKLSNNMARFLVAPAAVAAPLAGFAAEEKLSDAALMEPVKSVLDHFLKIQTEPVKDSMKGLES